MQSKINGWLIYYQLRWRAFVEELKEDERGLDGIVIAVILIVVGVMAAAAVWSATNGMLEKWWGQITGTSLEAPKLS